VLGPGGILGAAWIAGALGAVREHAGQDLGQVRTIVGTSAGSVLAAALRCGVPVETLVAHQRGDAVAALPAVADRERDSGRRPPLPRMRVGSPRPLAASARAPRRYHPHVAASALVPQGRARHDTLARFLRLLVAAAGDGDGDRWPGRQTWIVAVDYDAGPPVSFGRTGAPAASLPDAVVASPRIGGRRYVDGGIRSVASVDVCAGNASTRSTCSPRWRATSPTARPTRRGGPSG
jgi:NTE family protein